MKLRQESMRIVAATMRAIIQRHKLDTIEVSVTPSYWHFKAMLNRDNPVSKMRWQRALEKRANPELSVTLQQIEQAWKEIDIPLLVLTVDPKTTTTLAALKAFDGELIRLLDKMEATDFNTVYRRLQDGGVYNQVGG